MVARLSLAGRVAISCPLASLTNSGSKHFAIRPAVIGVPELQAWHTSGAVMSTWRGSGE